MDEAGMIRGFMAGLIRRAGGIEAAAALIGAGIGREVGKGTVSKRQAGVLDWPLVEIMALEDALGDACVRRWLARSLPEDGGRDLMLEIAEVSREHGEAIYTALAYATGSGARSVARKEVAEALEAVQRLAVALEESGREDAA